jgi:hypothetical protein
MTFIQIGDAENAVAAAWAVETMDTLVNDGGLFSGEIDPRRASSAVTFRSRSAIWRSSMPRPRSGAR